MRQTKKKENCRDKEINKTRPGDQEMIQMTGIKKKKKKKQL